MSAAIFGLLGVLVGGVLSSAGDAWLDRRRQLLEGMAAARLVSSELRKLDFEIHWMVAEGTAARGSEVVPLTLWDAHRTALAVVLSLGDWERVVRAQGVGERVNRFSREADVPLSERALRQLNEGLKEVTEARHLLSDVGSGLRLTKAQRAMFRATGGWLTESKPPAEDTPPAEDAPSSS